MAEREVYVLFYRQSCSGLQLQKECAVYGSASDLWRNRILNDSFLERLTESSKARKTSNYVT